MYQEEEDDACFNDPPPPPGYLFIYRSDMVDHTGIWLQAHEWFIDISGWALPMKSDSKGKTKNSNLSTQAFTWCGEKIEGEKEKKMNRV